MHKGFDRYAILAAHYAQQIAKWDWPAIKADACNNRQEGDFGEDEDYGSTFLGTVFAIMPSGKYHMPWTSNQTRSDCIRDEAFYDALEAVAGKHGMWLQSGEGDPCDMFAGCRLETAESTEKVAA